MKRGLGLLLSLLIIAAAGLGGWYTSKRTPYFDPTLFERPLPCSLSLHAPMESIPRDADEWLSSSLRAFGEPSLYQNRLAHGATSLRMTFMPAFTEPVVVRIDDLYGTGPTLTAHRGPAQVHPTPGSQHIKRSLSVAEVEPIRAFLDASKVLALSPDGCYSAPDGVIVLLEAKGPDGYRFINRWGPLYGAVYDLSNLMFDLTGWPNGEQGPDRWQDGDPKQAFVLTGVGRFAVFADVRSIVRQGDVVRMRSLQVVEEDFKIGDVAYWGGLSWWSFDCRLRTADRLDFSSVAVGGIEGPATPDREPAIAAAPGGDAEELLNIACARDWPLPDATGIWSAVSLGRERLAAA